MPQNPVTTTVAPRAPTVAPTGASTGAPTVAPTVASTVSPTVSPTGAPTGAPIVATQTTPIALATVAVGEKMTVSPAAVQYGPGEEIKLSTYSNFPLKISSGSSYAMIYKSDTGKVVFEEGDANGTVKKIAFDWTPHMTQFVVLSEYGTLVGYDTNYGKSPAGEQNDTALYERLTTLQFETRDPLDHLKGPFKFVIDPLYGISIQTQSNLKVWSPPYS